MTPGTGTTLAPQHLAPATPWHKSTMAQKSTWNNAHHGHTSSHLISYLQSISLVTTSSANQTIPQRDTVANVAYFKVSTLNIILIFGGIADSIPEISNLFCSRTDLDAKACREMHISFRVLNQRGSFYCPNCVPNSNRLQIH